MHCSGVEIDERSLLPPVVCSRGRSVVPDGVKHRADLLYLTRGLHHQDPAIWHITVSRVVRDAMERPHVQGVIEDVDVWIDNPHVGIKPQDIIESMFNNGVFDRCNLEYVNSCDLIGL
jgi:hypothetical protein